MKRTLCIVACLIPLALGLSTCIKPRSMPAALDPALVEAEIVKAKEIRVAAAEPPREEPVPAPKSVTEPPATKEPAVAMAEPARVPAVPTPQPPKPPVVEPIPPKPEPPKEPVPPKPEPPKEPTLPKPELPKEPTPPKPEPPKEPVAPKPEPPKEPAPPKPEPPKEPTPPKPEPPKEPTPPKPEPPKEPVAPKPEPPKEPVAPKPEPPKEPTPPKPEPPKPEPPKPEPPKPEPPKPEPVPAKPEPPKEAEAPDLFLFSPLQRRCFAAGETAEYTLVFLASGDLPNTEVTLSVANETGETWTATDVLRALPAGRHSLTYGIEAGCFPPGSYKVSARVGERKSGAVEMAVAPSALTTHFPLAAWLDKPPRTALDVQRWRYFLGLNTVLVQDRAPWGSESTLMMDEAFAATSRGMRGDPSARPLESGLGTPPFVAAGDLLTSGGLAWLSACSASGGNQGRLMPQRSLADPDVVRGAILRIQERLQAERRFRNFAGTLFTDEALLASAGGEAGLLDDPAQLAAYRKRFDAKDAPRPQGSQQWDDWYRFMGFRAGLLGECLARWADAVRAVDPRYVATSLLHSPTHLAEGAYPPLQARGLPVITATAPLTGPAGMMMPAAAVDLMHAGNWDKRVWFMPEVADDADLDEMRAPLFLALSRKIDGIVYPRNIDYLADRPAIGPGSTALPANISCINEQIAPFGDLLLALEKPRDDVAILYSLTEQIERIGRDPMKNPQAPAYPWSLIAAYNACMFAHFPAVFITEEDLLAKQKLQSKVILAIGLTRIRPEVKAALEKHVATGGVVLTDSATKVAIEGARPLGLEFPDLYQYDQNVQKIVPDEKTNPALERRDAVVQAKLLYPLLGQLRGELKQHIERDYTSADPDIVVCDQRCGAGRYIFLVNNTQRTDFSRGLKWELASAQTRLTLREGDYALYDALAHKRLYPIREKGHPTLSLVLPPGALRLYALLPDPIGGVSIGRASMGSDGLHVSASVTGESRSLFGAKAINAAVPLELVVKDPSGHECLHVYRAHTPKGYDETLPLAALSQPGRWTLTVRELFSGQEASTTFRVGGGSVAWASRKGLLAAVDGERISALLRSAKPLWIIAGTEAEAAKAEPLAAALRTPAREVEVKLAAQLASPRKLSAAEKETYLSAAPGNAPMPDIRQDAILLGDVATNPLLQAVHNSGVLPRTVTPDTPGPGGALLCFVLSPFEPETACVVAAAADAAGVDAAIHALLAAAAGRAPSVAWQPVATSRALAAAKPQKQPGIERLAPAWKYRGSDVVTCAAMPLQGNDVTVGFYDGMVLSFNSTGKEVWRRRCTTRTRAVARSLDGVWAAVASFPEVLLLSAQGRLQFGAIIEPSERADNTAVAISPDGMLTLAGTRQGAVIAYDLQGNKVFAIGDKDADEKKEGWQSRLGCVNVLSIAPRTAVAVAGCEQATVAVDPKGQELWASTDLNRVTCLASSYSEEQTVAVGTRAGVVACVSGGTTLWRAQAEGPVMSVCYRGETQEIIAASLDGTLACYDKNGKVLWTRRSPTGFRFVASSLDGTLLAAAELGGRVVLLNKAGNPVAEMAPVAGAIRALTFSADGASLVVGTAAGEVVSFKFKRAAAEQDEL